MRCGNSAPDNMWGAIQKIRTLHPCARRSVRLCVWFGCRGFARVDKGHHLFIVRPGVYILLGSRRPVDRKLLITSTLHLCFPSVAMSYSHSSWDAVVIISSSFLMISSHAHALLPRPRASRRIHTVEERNLVQITKFHGYASNTSIMNHLV